MKYGKGQPLSASFSERWASLIKVSNHIWKLAWWYKGQMAHLQTKANILRWKIISYMMKWLRCNLCKQEVVFLHCRKCSRQSSPFAVFFTAPRFLPCCSIICCLFFSFSVFRHLVVNMICIVYTSYLDLLCRFYHQGRCITRHSAARSNMLFIKKKS